MNNHTCNTCKLSPCELDEYGDCDVCAVEKAKIDEMDQLTMAAHVRWAPIGHKYFYKGSMISDHFYTRFNLLGRTTPEINEELKYLQASDFDIN